MKKQAGKSQLVNIFLYIFSYFFQNLMICCQPNNIDLPVFQNGVFVQCPTTLKSILCGDRAHNIVFDRLETSWKHKVFLPFGRFCYFLFLYSKVKVSFASSIRQQELFLSLPFRISSLNTSSIPCSMRRLSGLAPNSLLYPFAIK